MSDLAFVEWEKAQKRLRPQIAPHHSYHQTTPAPPDIPSNASPRVPKISPLNSPEVPHRISCERRGEGEDCTQFGSENFFTPRDVHPSKPSQNMADSRAGSRKWDTFLNSGSLPGKNQENSHKPE